MNHVCVLRAMRGFLRTYVCYNVCRIVVDMAKKGCDASHWTAEQKNCWLNLLWWLPYRISAFDLSPLHFCLSLSLSHPLNLSDERKQFGDHTLCLSATCTSECYDSNILIKLPALETTTPATTKAQLQLDFSEYWMKFYLYGRASVEN